MSHLRVRLAAVHGRDIRVVVWTTHGTLREVRLVVTRDGTRLASERLASVDTRRRTVELMVPRGVSTRGRLTVTASGDR